MSEIANVIIASSYFLIATVTIPIWLYLPIPLWLRASLAFSATVFFTGCGLHHADMAVHGALAEPVELDATHLLIFDLMQATAGPVFAVLGLVATGRYVVLRAEARRDTASIDATRKPQ